MWAVIKIDKKKIKLLEQDFLEKLGNDFRIYRPKISINKRLHKIDEEIYDIEKKIILNNCKYKVEK